MSPTKHTPGPWRATPIGTTFSIDAVEANYAGIAFINPLGMHDAGIPNATDKANARLIATAPDLLEFTAMVARMKTEEEFGDDMPASEDWISTLNELIVSARVLIGKTERT